MAQLGQAQPVALVEPRASFTLTSRHSPRQSCRRTRANTVGIRSLSFLEKKSQMVRRDFSRAVPETFAMVDGLQVTLSKKPRSDSSVAFTLAMDVGIRPFASYRSAEMCQVLFRMTDICRPVSRAREMGMRSR
jgi:hypothetical protein